MPGTDRSGELDKLGEELASLEGRAEELGVAVERNHARLDEMIAYRSSVEQEAARLERAMKAGSVLADLKVAHCPVCDQAVAPNNFRQSSAICAIVQLAPARRRQMRHDLKWRSRRPGRSCGSHGNGVSVGKGQGSLGNRARASQDRIVQIRSMLRPVRTAAAAVLPPQIGLLDMKVGQKQEQIAQIDRVARSLAYRDVLNGEIQKIQQETSVLEQGVRSKQFAGLREGKR